MATEASSQAGIYVYAVVSSPGQSESSTSIDYGPIGLGGADVYRIDADGLSAIVSKTEQTRLRPERRNVAAHTAVLRKSLDEASVLPMAFGLVASSEQAVRDLIGRNRKALREQLERVAGKVEMGLRVIYDLPNVFEYYVNTHPALREARDAIGDVRHATHGEMLALGQLFERTLNEERETLYGRVRAVLERHGIGIKRNDPRNEREVMHLACLIPRELQGGFEGIVGEAAAAFDNHYTFDINGPWAPHNFVELNLKG